MQGFDVLQIIVAWLLATSAMTAFSYLLSLVFKQRFREPKLLNDLMVDLRPSSFSVSRGAWVGWILHYFIGFIFAVIYEYLRIGHGLTPTNLTALFYGTAAGIVGIIGWKGMFSITEIPPKINFTGFAIQLFFAHLIYAFFLMLVYRIWL